MSIQEQRILAEVEEINTASINPLWYPPMKWWRFSLLMLFSFSLYSLFFVYKTYKDLKANVDTRLSPGWHVFGFLIPAVNIFLFYFFARQIESIGVQSAQVAKLPLIILTFFYALISSLSYLASDSYFLIGLVVYISPWLYLQHRLNKKLLTLENPSWRTTPNRFTLLQRILIAAGAVFIIIVIVGMYAKVSKNIGSQDIAAGTVFVDEGKIFQLTIKNAGWKRAKAEALVEGAELELINPATDAWAIVYVTESVESSIDDQVDFRRGQIKGNDENSKLIIEEIRSFLPDTEMIPVSYAKYKIRSTMRTEFWYVATIRSPKYMIEMIAYHSEGGESDNGFESLVKGLTIYQNKEMIK